MEWLLAIGGTTLGKAGAAILAVLGLMVASWRAGSRQMRLEAEKRDAEARAQAGKERANADRAAAEYPDPLDRLRSDWTRR